MRRSNIIAALSFWVLICAGAALAQAPGTAPADGAAKQLDPAKRGEKLEERFKAADKDGDGKLTKDEAEAGIPRVAKHFDEPDKDRKGYLTLEDVKAGLKQLRGQQN